MEYKISGENINEFMDEMSELVSLLNDRISDLHEVKGGMQARHPTYFTERS